MNTFTESNLDYECQSNRRNERGLGIHLPQGREFLGPGKRHICLLGQCKQLRHLVKHVLGSRNLWCIKLTLCN